MSDLTAEEEAAVKKMEEDFQKAAAPLKPGAKVRPERFSDFAPGMSDDGELFPVPDVAPAPRKKR
jgi:hypothetical protein